MLQDSSNHISFQAMSRVSLLSLSFGKMKFSDFLADEISCHRRSWWFLFFAFLWYPCRSFSRFWLFYNGWCFLNNFCFGYLGIHGQWISKLMFIPFVLHVFDKMSNVKTLSIFKEFGLIPFMKFVYFHEKSLVQSSRLILGHIIMWTLEFHEQDINMLLWFASHF